MTTKRPRSLTLLLPFALLFLIGCADSNTQKEQTTQATVTKNAPVTSTNVTCDAASAPKEQQEAVAPRPAPVVDVLATARESRPFQPRIEAVLRSVRETLEVVTNNWTGPAVCDGPIFSSDKIYKYACAYEESSEYILGYPKKPDISDYLPGCAPFPIELPADITATNVIRIAQHRIRTAQTPEDAMSIYQDVLQTEMQLHTLFNLDRRYTCDGTAFGMLCSYWDIGHECRLLNIWEETEDGETRARWNRIKNVRGPFQGITLQFENGFTHVALNPNFNPEDGSDSPDLVLLYTAPERSFSWDGHDYILFSCGPFADMSDELTKYYIGRIDRGTLTAYSPISYDTFAGKICNVENGVLKVKTEYHGTIQIPLPTPDVQLPPNFFLKGLTEGEAAVIKAKNARPIEKSAAAVIQRTRETLHAVMNHRESPSREKIPFPSAGQILDLATRGCYWKTSSYGENDTIPIEYDEPLPGFSPFPIQFSDEITATNLERIARCRIRMAQTPEEAASIYQDVVNVEMHANALQHFNTKYPWRGSGIGGYFCQERIEQECRMLQTWEEVNNKEKKTLWDRVKNAEGFFKDVLVSFESGTAFAVMNPDFDPTDDQNDDPWISTLWTTPANSFTENGHDYIVFKISEIVDGSGDSTEYYVGLIENRTLVRYTKICGKRYNYRILSVGNGILHFGSPGNEDIQIKLPLPPKPVRRR